MKRLPAAQYSVSVQVVLNISVMHIDTSNVVHIGCYSTYFGRKLTIAVACVFVGAFIPLWVFGPNIQSIQFGSFVLQFFVQVSATIKKRGDVMRTMSDIMSV